MCMCVRVCVCVRVLSFTGVCVLFFTTVHMDAAPAGVCAQTHQPQACAQIEQSHTRVIKRERASAGAC